MDILFLQYLRKTKKTTESVVFYLYLLFWRQNITDFLFFEYREYEMSIFKVSFILFMLLYKSYMYRVYFLASELKTSHPLFFLFIW